MVTVTVSELPPALKKGEQEEQAIAVRTIALARRENAARKFITLSSLIDS
jgi:hypothetical protein